MDPLKIKTKSGDGAALVVDGTLYHLCFPLSALAWLEKKTGRTRLWQPDQWLGMKAVDVPLFLAAGLVTHHEKEAEDLARRVCDAIGLEGVERLIDLLLEAAFPELVQRAREQLERKKAKIPNVPSAAVR